ncbi:AMP-binding protein [Rhodobacteraceae bacterium 2CG4]|uniref:AMP-binding protein n=1 Tax=Halovulum marinum TaxID=2662447 RepID=A0A6L5Z3T9_9RHOB|nr:non-ribosomal peptide synthetase [Halovulum marinum]MSU90745.1 AMP-binding protein [Halovulum marinum]
MNDVGEVERTLHDVARNAGSRTALHGADEQVSLSFAQLSDQIRAASGALAALGVPRDAVIAFSAGSEFRAAQLFLLLGAHAPVFPIPAHATDAEIEGLLRLVNPSVVVVSDPASASARIAAASGLPVIAADADADGGIRFGRAAGDPPAAHGRRRIAGQGVVLTTSGTTGTPKMVALDAARLASGAGRVAATLGLGPSDLSVEIMPLHHIHGLVAGLLAPVLSGGAVVVAGSPDPQRLLELSADHGASWYTAVPTMHRAIQRAARARPDLAAACRFRLIRSSSSAMPQEVRAGLAGVFACPVVEAYGMTEATHQMSAQRPDAPAAHGDVGHPPPGTLRIQDAGGAPLPQGQTGEVAVRSDTVIESYVDNPAADAATFIDGWMRTGDIGRLNPDSSLTLVGRAKEMIKRGGAQISPLEIEDALLAQPGVADAIAFGVPHPTLEQDVAAAVVIAADAPCDPRQLRAQLLDLISDYKVPSRILLLDEIPKGPTGKPRRLDMQHLFADALRGGFEQPRSPTEDMVAALFEEVLETPAGRHDDFFLAGGDSLSGTGLVTQLNILLGTAISPEMLFRYSTPAELASHIETLDGGRIRDRIDALLDAAPGHPAART